MYAEGSFVVLSFVFLGDFFDLPFEDTVSSQLPVFHNLNSVFWSNKSKTIFFLYAAGSGEWEGYCLQKSCLLPVCSKPIMTHLRETLIIYFRAVQAWVSGGIPQIKHSNHQKFLLFVHISKLRN